MRIQLLSDLHLETQPQFCASPAVGADLLVLAGDIGSYQSGSRLQDADFGLARFSPLPQYGAWPTPVVFVPGNHEYDKLDFDTAHARLRATCERLGLIWLERESITIDGVRFIGTTLWSDFDALIHHKGITDPARQQAQREKAFRAANYYLRKTGGTRAGLPFLAEQVRAQSQACQRWLRTALSEPFDGSTVVVTHFAPSLRSADPRFGLVPGTAGFCNALDDCLQWADFWLHGHLHYPCDYEASGLRTDASRWHCRVISNPLGYRGKGEQQLFRAHCTIDV